MAREYAPDELVRWLFFRTAAGIAVVCAASIAVLLMGR